MIRYENAWVVDDQAFLEKKTAVLYLRKKLALQLGDSSNMDHWAACFTAQHFDELKKRFEQHGVG